jgi:hypothetical protein
MSSQHLLAGLAADDYGGSSSIGNSPIDLDHKSAIEYDIDPMAPGNEEDDNPLYLHSSKHQYALNASIAHSSSNSSNNNDNENNKYHDQHLNTTTTVIPMNNNNNNNNNNHLHNNNTANTNTKPNANTNTTSNTKRNAYEHYNNQEFDQTTSVISTKDIHSLMDFGSSGKDLPSLSPPRSSPSTSQQQLPTPPPSTRVSTKHFYTARRKRRRDINQTNVDDYIPPCKCAELSIEDASNVVVVMGVAYQRSGMPAHVLQHRVSLLAQHFALDAKLFVTPFTTIFAIHRPGSYVDPFASIDRQAIASHYHAAST